MQNKYCTNSWTILYFYTKKLHKNLQNYMQRSFYVFDPISLDFRTM